MFDFLSVVPFNKIKRLKRIAEAFNTKKDGPFRVIGNTIELVSDDMVTLGYIEIKSYDADLYYFSVVMNKICTSFDEKYRQEFFEHLELLLWLDSLWGITESVTCPICLVSVFVNDEISVLINHIENEHKTVVVHSLESCGCDVRLKTNIGDYVLKDCKVY